MGHGGQLTSGGRVGWHTGTGQVGRWTVGHGGQLTAGGTVGWHTGSGHVGVWTVGHTGQLTSGSPVGWQTGNGHVGTATVGHGGDEGIPGIAPTAASASTGPPVPPGCGHTKPPLTTQAATGQVAL